MTTTALVWSVLTGRGWRGRLRDRLSGGLTALQVWQRLDPADRDRLGEGSPAAERAGVDAVRGALEELVVEGRVERRRVRMTVPLNTKGPRDVVVDVFRPR